MQPVPPTLPANRLREIRIARGIRLTDLAHECRVDPSTVQRWERSVITWRHVPTIAQMLDVSVPYLLGMSDEEDDGDDKTEAA